MPMSTYRKFGGTPEELIKTNVTLKDYGGGMKEVSGGAVMEVTVGSKTIPTAFFIFEGKVNYSALLGRDWIHANCCIPSTLHQCLVQWVSGNVEVVHADKSVTMAAADFGTIGLEDLPCLSGTYWEGESIEISEDGVTVTGGSGTPRML